MLEIDGSEQSGSGTIVRDAVPFCILTGQEIHTEEHQGETGQTRPGGPAWSDPARRPARPAGAPAFAAYKLRRLKFTDER